MPEHLKAFLVVFVLSWAVFRVAETALGTRLESTEDRQFLRHLRNGWLAITALAFLSHNFWLFLLLAGFVAYRLSHKVANPLALFAALIVAAPPFDRPIPGIGPIEHVLYLSLPRALSISVLLPFALRLARAKERTPVRLMSWDGLILLLLIVFLMKQLTYDSIVGTSRAAVYLFLDIWLPYYVASRTLLNPRAFLNVALSLTVVGCVLGVIALFESTRFWLLYESLRTPLGIGGIPGYLLRMEGGPLRALGTAGNSIVLGFVLMVCLFAGLLVYKVTSSRIARLLGIAAIIAGLVSTVSRGPWVGAFAGLVVLSFSGPQSIPRLAKYSVAVFFLAVPILFTPMGQKVISYLPFVGTVDPGSADYRSTLWNLSLQVFLQNPFFGDVGYLNNPILAPMRTGLGIIDIVNTYLQIALPFGGVGVLLFCAVLWLPTIAVLTRARAIQTIQPEWARIGYTLGSIGVAISITIATVSSIGVIQVYCWLLIGLSVNYLRSLPTPSHDGLRCSPI